MPIHTHGLIDGESNQCQAYADHDNARVILPCREDGPGH